MTDSLLLFLTHSLLLLFVCSRLLKEYREILKHRDTAAAATATAANTPVEITLFPIDESNLYVWNAYSECECSDDAMLSMFAAHAYMHLYCHLTEWMAPLSSVPLSSLLLVLGPPDTPYSDHYFTLRFDVPKAYPLSPPKVTFVSRVCHPNVHFKTGEICLDVLKDQWTPM